LPVLVRGARFAIILLGAVLLAAPACTKKEPAFAALSGTLTPDAPEGFGPRIVWFAFRSSPETVARALELKNPASSSWADGLKAAYQGRVFITPPIAETGWVLAASTRFPDPGDRGHRDEATPTLERLSRTLGEVQYFATYDVLDLHAWARFVNGTAVRKLAFLGADNLLLWADGEPTPKERELSVAFVAKGVIKEPFPTEENVFAIAGAWSVDPTTLQTRNLPPSLGVVGSPP
jgi:hypothetical protein